MGIQLATALHPVNSTVVDSGGAIDVRLLDSAEAGANDDTQTVTATHTQDSVERTFDPATGGATNTNNAGTTLFTCGWALRLPEDMTPADDTNCNAVLTAGTLTVRLSVAINQAGGTYTTGSYGPTWRASLWRYNPSTNTGTLIAAGTQGAGTWDYTPVTGDIGTFKSQDITIVLASLVEFSAGEILLLQVGLNTGTIPNPTLGTATWTYTLRVDNVNTNITFAAGQGIRSVCYTGAAISGTGDAAGVIGSVLPTSAAITGDGALAGVQGAIAQMSSAITGSGTLDGKQAAIAQMSSTITGSGDMSGVIAAVLGTVGTVDSGGGGGGGGTTVHPAFSHFE